jgi:hypothetical protein
MNKECAREPCSDVTAGATRATPRILSLDIAVDLRKLVLGRRESLD